MRPIQLVTIRERIYHWFDHRLNYLEDYTKKSWWPLIFVIGMFWIIAQVCLWLNEPIEVTYTDDAFNYVGPEDEWNPNR